MNELGLIDVLDWKKQLENQLRNEWFEEYKRTEKEVELETIEWVLKKLEVSE